MCVCMGPFLTPPVQRRPTATQGLVASDGTRIHAHTNDNIVAKTLMLAQHTPSKARHANDSLHKDGSEVVVVAYTPEDKSAINK